MSNAPRPKISRRERVVPSFAMGVACLSLLVLLGWLLKIPLLNGLPDQVAIKTSTLIGLTGLSVFFLAVIIGLFAFYHRCTTREPVLDATLGQLQRGVLDRTMLSVIATEPNGVIREFNSGVEQLLGYTKDEVVGKQTPAVFHIGHEVVARAAELSMMFGRKFEPDFDAFVAKARLGKVDEREWTYVRKDGSRLPVLLRVSALRDQRGAITGIFMCGAGHNQ